MIVALAVRPIVGLCFAIALVAVPGVQDQILGNPTNVQWVLAPTLVMLLLTARRSIGNTVFTTIAAFTGPFSIVLMPIAAIRLMKHRDAIAAIALLAGTVQAIILLKTYSPPDAVSHGTLLHLIERMVQNSMPSTVINILGGGAIVAICLYERNYRNLRLGFLFACVAILASTAFKFRSNPLVFDNLGSVRYFYPVQVLLWWCAISLLFIDRSRNVAAAWLVITIVTYAASNPTGLIFDSLKDTNWKEEIRDIGKRPLLIPVNPEGWSLTIRP